MHGVEFVTDVALAVGIGGLMSIAMRFVKLPALVGYLLAGLLIGPFIPIPLFADPERMEALSSFGVILVMFSVGLELRMARFIKVLPRAGLVAVVEMGTLLFTGFSVGRLFGWTNSQALFLGGGIAISSTMVVSKVLETRPVAATVRQLVFGVLVIQDVVAILLITILTSVAAGSTLAPEHIASTIASLVATLVATIAVGLLVVPRAVDWVARRESPELLMIIALGICFAMAVLAHLVGYSVALGAFVAGMLVAESAAHERIEKLVAPIKDLFAAIFFVSVGMVVDPLLAVAHLPSALLVVALVVVIQLVTVTVAGVLSGNRLETSLTAGLTLGQIGEFAFIMVGIAVAAGIAPPALRPIAVTAALVTTVTTPLLLSLSKRLVCAVDHHLPARLATLLTLYGEWFERLEAPRDDEGGRSMARHVKVIVIDTVVVVFVVVGSILGGPRLEGLLVDHGLGSLAADIVITAATLLVAAPFLVSLGRAAISLSRLVVERILPRPEAGGTTTNGATSWARETLRATVRLALLAGLGVPMVAALRPVLPAPYAGLLLSAAFVTMGAILWRAAGRADSGISSRAGRLASLVARGRGTTRPVTAEADATAGLYHIVGVALGDDAHAVGKTLIDLDLRASTGASVIAIHRTGGQDVTAPTGREPFSPGDTLVVTGSRKATNEASRLLTSGPPTPPPAAPDAPSMPPVSHG